MYHFKSYLQKIKYLLLLLLLLLLTSVYQLSVSGSPRLGTDTESYGQIIINFNDNANGELVLSPLNPSVTEDVTGDFLYVTRYGGAFGEVGIILCKACL